jgi:RNA polymerase sigma-70 factor (ECF subfamily)
MMKAMSSETADVPAPETDEVLLSRYRDSGLQADFDELVRRYEKELYRYLVRYLGDPALAEDVFQNTFLQVHLKRGLYEDGRAVRPWLYSIATHQAVDALRRQGRRATVSLDQRASGGGDDSDATSLVDMLTSGGSTPLAELQEAERRDWVRKSVAALPDTLRQTVLLAYDKDLKYREIAELLGIPVGTVKSRLHAALTKLQEMAKKSLGDRDD